MVINVTHISLSKSGEEKILPGFVLFFPRVDV